MNKYSCLCALHLCLLGCNEVKVNHLPDASVTINQDTVDSGADTANEENVCVCTRPPVIACYLHNECSCNKGSCSCNLEIE